MVYRDTMKTPLFNFGGIKKHEVIIENTWQEFRAALANKDFKYNEIDRALTTTFLKVFDNMFFNCNKNLERLLGSFGTGGYLVRGTKLKKSEVVLYDRFLPKSEFINEDNRFSPAGVEWLYLAWSSDKVLANECAINECRATSGDRFGICSFEINPFNASEKIIDLTLADEMTYEDINTKLEDAGKSYRSLCYERTKKTRQAFPTESEKEKLKTEISFWVLYTYLKLLSERIFTPLDDMDDKNLMYAPFQCMAQYFLNKGYVGIKYKSTVCMGAKDIVLFDKTLATPVGPIQDFVI